MSIERLAKVLKKVGFDIDPVDVADIIWLARYLSNDDEFPDTHKDTIATSDGEKKVPGDKEKVTANGYDKPQQDITNQEVEAEGNRDGAGIIREEVPARADLYLPSRSLKQAGGLSFRSAGTSALPGKLAYSRALRPLLRGVPSDHHFTLDEDATIHRIADTQVWLPIMRPERSRWLELDIVVDEWASTALWRDSIRELIVLLTNLGAFRSVQTWSLWTYPQKKVIELHSGWGASAKTSASRPIKELNSIRGNRLVLVLSDCVSPGWFNGAIGNILEKWGRSEIVVLLHLLPHKYWQRTGLVNAIPVLLRSIAPGKSNTQLEVVSIPDNHEGLPTHGVISLPVLPFDPSLISTWAQAIAGKNNLWFPGVLLPLDNTREVRRRQAMKNDSALQSRVHGTADDVDAKARMLVERYRQNASPEAWKLAGYLSATTPLNLRLIQLIQQVMLSEVRLDHVAEFYLSGLIKRQDQNDILEGEAYFEFLPGVRNVLLSSIKRSEVVDVLRQTTHFVNKETGKLIDFDASVAMPELASKPDLQGSPFAQVLGSVLRKLGGEYSHLADALEGKKVFQERIASRINPPHQTAEKAKRKGQRRRTCFVIMPFGDKLEANGRVIRFDEIYHSFIKPTIDEIDIECMRSDEIMEAGGIHNKIFANIYDADVAVVDITMLNPNVFYELGMRHTVKRNVTIIIQHAGTKIPFNISGFTIVPYKLDDPVALKHAADLVQTMIKNGLANVKKSDSPIYGVLPNLKVENFSQTITKKQVFSFHMVNVPGKEIGIITGDLQKVEEVDVWVNSENINMQMARPYDRSISATIRFLGAKKDQTNAVEEDIIANELSKALGSKTSVAPGTVLYTSAGDLAVTNNVKRILHAASVIGRPGGGYSTMENTSICVRNALTVLDDPRKLASEKLTSIIFPLFGVGISVVRDQEVAQDLIDEAIAYLEDNPTSNVEKVYFLASSEIDLELCYRILIDHPSVSMEDPNSKMYKR